MSIVFWFLAPMFGLAAIVVSRIVAGLNPLLPASYVGTLSHFHFIAFSISMLSIAELVELAVNTRREDAKGRRGIVLGLDTLSALLLSFLIFSFYFSALQADMSQNPHFTSADVAAIFSFLVATTILGLNIRVQLERTREQ